MFEPILYNSDIVLEDTYKGKYVKPAWNTFNSSDPEKRKTVVLRPRDSDKKPIPIMWRTLKKEFGETPPEGVLTKVSKQDILDKKIRGDFQGHRGIRTGQAQEDRESIKPWLDHDKEEIKRKEITDLSQDLSSYPEAQEIQTKNLFKFLRSKHSDWSFQKIHRAIEMLRGNQDKKVRKSRTKKVSTIALPPEKQEKFLDAFYNGIKDLGGSSHAGFTKTPIPIQGLHQYISNKIGSDKELDIQHALNWYVTQLVKSGQAILDGSTWENAKLSIPIIKSFVKQRDTKSQEEPKKKIMFFRY